MNEVAQLRFVRLKKIGEGSNGVAWLARFSEESKEDT